MLRYSFPEGHLCRVQSFARNAICRKSAAPVKDTAPSARGSKACAFASTVSIIVPIAGKRAKSPWPPPVVNESKSFRLLLDADARLAAAAGGVVHYLADAAGLENGVVARLQSAVIAACAEAFEHLTTDHPQLEITFTRLADRMEVALSHRGEGSPAVGPETIAGFAARIGGTKSKPGVFAGFDRVQYETHDGEAVTRLTKYIG
jgi:hypothetical protein